MSLRAKLTHLLNTSKDDNQFPSKPISMFETLPVKKFFLRAYLNVLWNSLGPFALTLLLVMWEETLATLISALNSSSCQDLPDLTIVCPLYPYLETWSLNLIMEETDTLLTPTRYPSMGLPAAMNILSGSLESPLESGRVHLNNL